MNIIFSIDASIEEHNYEKMAILLARSIKDTNPNAKMFCGCFTNRVPQESTIVHLLKLGVVILMDKKFQVLDDSINYFLRNYTMHYFAKRLDKFLYIDIDAIVLGDLTNIYQSNKLYVEEVLENILVLESKYIDIPNHKLFYNWFQIVNRETAWVYDLDYSTDYIRYMKNSDIAVSKNIIYLDYTHQTIGAYYPKHKLSKESLLFHYDGFIDSGTFYQLEYFDYKKYKRYNLLCRLLNLRNTNDKQYWT